MIPNNKQINCFSTKTEKFQSTCLSNIIYILRLKHALTVRAKVILKIRIGQKLINLPKLNN